MADAGCRPRGYDDDNAFGGIVMRAPCRAIPAFCCLLWVIVASAGQTGHPALLRDRRPEARPRLLVLGLSHFANPGRDVNDVRVDDMLGPARQRQIEALFNALAKWKPTHVAVEWPITKQAELDKRYQAFRRGRYKLGVNEVYQVGFRLAAKLGLPRVDAIDWNGMPPGKRDDYDYQAWAARHGDQARLNAIRAFGATERETALLARSTLTQYL
jgi:Family of unknown function (DUF5694)